MNYEFFIAKRIIAGKSYKSSISAPIIKIAIAAIAIGLVMMMIAIATGVGLQQKIREKVSAFNGHILISTYDNNNSEVSINPISNDQDFYPQFKALEEVDHIQAVASKGGIIRTETTFEGMIYKGVGNEYRWNYFDEYLLEGRLPDYSERMNGEVLMSAYMANRLLVGVNDRVTAFFPKEDPNRLPNELKLTIVGIYDSGFKEFDETYVIGDIRQVQRMNKWDEDQVGSFEVFVKDFDDIQELGEQVYVEIPPLLNSYTIVDKYDHIFEWLKLFDVNILIIIVIMIIVGGINMITALLVLILEKTQMIGMLKSMGSENSSIRKIFLYNAAYLILIGLFWGNVIGLGLLWLQKTYGIISLDPATYYVTQAPVYISAGYIILLNIGTLLLCLLMLLVPSYIISRITPVKAIKFA